MDINSLIKWFNETKRIFPWRENPTPYQVWISEVMLQQTRASVVIPYFESWMEQFPTIKALAEAPEEEVIKCWEGLGYYSRARNLQAAAKQITIEHNGVLPSDPKALKALKGIGPYTLGAIRSFAFHQKAAAVDGNVMRVLSRHLAIDDDTAKPATLKKFYQVAEGLLPEETPWIVSEALIELGATLCLPKKPKCLLCPIKSNCKAFLEGRTQELPFKSKKVKITKLHRSVAIINYKDKFLVSKGEKGKVMQGLFEFPYFEGKLSPTLFHEQVEELVGEATTGEELSIQKHTFTRFHATLYPKLFLADEAPQVDGMQWIRKQELLKLPFSSGHRKIMADMKLT